MSLSGKVIIVTGASRGIGKAIAIRVAAEGAKVVINYLSNSKTADAVVEQIGADRAIAVQADASKITDIDRLVDATVAKFGKIDIVIPNAGILLVRDLEATSEEDFDKAFAVNVKGPYFLTQRAARHMPAGGRVVLISTSVNSASWISAGYLLYASTKGAIDQMTRVMAKDLGRKGILVNAIAPGPTETEMFFEGKSEQLLDSLRKTNPFNRFGQPEEIASAVAFLCGSDSSWVSGQVVRVNGAMA
ncbi:hypothetical protein ASPZODRAFT_141910 [Penicilliopsis zonata CBS 506.65]|uniref:Uncharacterized protein n=1 Tax=Penicilliopsis zonata CBS 506.65 TaxID=1073090 RepID=A0A1L9SIW8_9EURO|nr:hypothetical protein ASPZODRAFT_141910 [Penicilliopsis zonata CBS 506.65]OJJ47155.1 hypothetical protein ASPZODRAFT_141910 [Penicilliopsis zonata CBS 506.65]